MLYMYNKSDSKKGRNSSKFKGANKPKSKSNINIDRNKGDKFSDVKVSDNINNPTFYFTDETLKNQISNISFNQFTGVPFAIGTDAIDGRATTIGPSSIMAIALNPSAGFTNTDSPNANSVNLAMLSLYTKLSANNAKTTSYAPQDLATLLFALGNVISMSSFITRLFGIARLFNIRNRAYPSQVMAAMNVDYDDLKMNFSDYRNRFNLDLVSISQIPIPANIPYFTKCSEIYSGLYLDMDGSSMAQTYLFYPYSAWLFDEAYSADGSGLETTAIFASTGLTKLSSILTTFENMINALLNSSTLNAIYSDILRVADKEGVPLYSFTTVPDDYFVLPTYNPEVRKWINNLVIMGAPMVTGYETGYTPDNDVEPNANMNWIVYRPQFETFTRTQLQPIINFDSGNITNDDVIEATRLSATFTSKLNEAETNYVTTKVALPDHYVVSVRIIDAYGSAHPLAHPVVAVNSTNYMNVLAILEQASNFDWAPFIYVADSNASLSNVIGDVNYYTTVSMEYLERLQDTTYFGLLSIR